MLITKKMLLALTIVGALVGAGIGALITHTGSGSTSASTTASTTNDASKAKNARFTAPRLISL